MAEVNSLAIYAECLLIRATKSRWGATYYHCVYNIGGY